MIHAGTAIADILIGVAKRPVAPTHDHIVLVPRRDHDVVDNRIFSQVNGIVWVLEHADTADTRREPAFLFGINMASPDLNKDENATALAPPPMNCRNLLRVISFIRCDSYPILFGRQP
jgi:hypothetical protein